MALLVAVNVGIVPPVNLNAVLYWPVKVLPLEGWVINIEPDCPTAWLLGAAKVVFCPSVILWWQDNAKSKVTLDAADTVVIFAAAPPVSAMPPEAVSNFFTLSWYKFKAPF